MAELHSRFFFKHPDQITHRQLVILFSLGDLNSKRRIKDLNEFESRFLDIAAEINPDDGEDIAYQLLADFDDKYGEAFGSESIGEQAGYCVSNWVNGSQGQYIAGRLVKFIYELCPQAHAQAWGCGDDDPWEYWYKMQDGYVVLQQDEPYCEDDAYIKNTIYRWWHEEMPEEIREGFLNGDDEDESEDGDEEFSEEEYQQWLTRLKESSDGSDQELESPISTDDVKEIMGVFGSLFRAFTGPKVAGPEALGELATRAEMLTEEVVMQAFDDMNEAEKRRDIEGVLKHFSPKLKGRSLMYENGQPIKMPVTYGMSKLSLKMLLNDRADLSSAHQVTGFKASGDGRATLSFDNQACYNDPVKGDRVTTHTREAYTYALVDGVVQIVEMVSEEVPA